MATDPELPSYHPADFCRLADERDALAQRVAAYESLLQPISTGIYRLHLGDTVWQCFWCTRTKDAMPPHTDSCLTMLARALAGGE